MRIWRMHVLHNEPDVSPAQAKQTRAVLRLRPSRKAVKQALHAAAVALLEPVPVLPYSPSLAAMV